VRELQEPAYAAPARSFRILDRVAEDLKEVGEVTDRAGKIIGRDVATTVSPLQTAKKTPRRAGPPAP